MFTVDMLTPQTFSQITIDSGSSTGDFTHAYEIYVSADGVNWGTAIASGTGASQVVTSIFPAQTARYFCIVQTGAASNW
jgi:hypothetical protein